MWYSSQQQQQQHQQQQQQQCWHGYAHHLSPQHPSKQTYSRTSYYCHTDELSNRNPSTTSYSTRRTEENESLVHYHPTRVDDVYGKKKKKNAQNKLFQENKFDLHLRLRLIIPMSVIIYFSFQVSLYFLFIRQTKDDRTRRLERKKKKGSSIECFDHQHSVQRKARTICCIYPICNYFSHLPSPCAMNDNHNGRE